MAAKKMPGHRAAISGFTVNLGLLNVNGDLIVPRETGSNKADQFKLCCPECPDATAVKQGYTCEHGHGPFVAGDCGHAKEVDKVLFKVTDEEYEEARNVDLDKNYLALTVHNTDEIAPLLLQDGLTYIVRPAATAENLKGYSALIRALRENPNLTMVGVCNIRNAEKFMRVAVGLNNQLMMTELVWPGDLRSHEDSTIPVDDKLVGMVVNAFAEVSEFEPENYVKSTREKIAALVASKTGVEQETNDGDNDVDENEMNDLEAEFRKLLKAS